MPSTAAIFCCMRIAVITNTDNGAGLERDAQILKERLTELGHEVRCEHFQRPGIGESDVNLFVEVLVPAWFARARRNLFIPNPEWFFSSWVEHLPRLDIVLCKTRYAMELFTGWGARRVEFLGFESFDVRMEGVTPVRRALHVAGLSDCKNTAPILECWRRWRMPVPLTVVWRKLPFDRREDWQTTLYNWLPEHELRRLQNVCLYHLYPSEHEGWGHVLHEACSVGGLVLSTNQRPMTEFYATVRIPAFEHRVQQFVPMYAVTPEAVYDGVHRMVSMTAEGVLSARQASRIAFETERAEFRANLKRIFTELERA